MQALYQWDLSGNNLSDIEIQFLQDEDFSKADKDYFHELLHEVPARLDEVEAAFSGYLDRLGTAEQHTSRISTTIDLAPLPAPESESYSAPSLLRQNVPPCGRCSVLPCDRRARPPI